MKLGQSVYLDEISDRFGNEPSWVNWVTSSYLRKTLCMLLKPHFQSDYHETWSECYFFHETSDVFENGSGQVKN